MLKCGVSSALSTAAMAFATFAVVVAFTSVVLLLAGGPPFAAYQQILLGALGSWVKFTHVVKIWVPLTLCACGLLFTFRIGLWNIGVEGQVMLGAVAAVWVLRSAGDAAGPGWVWQTASLVAAVAGGGIWAGLAGYLKTKAGVNEIFAGLGLNFVAQGVVLWLIFGPWKQPGVASMSGTATLSEALWLYTPAALRIPPVALVLATLALLATALLLERTRFGLAVKAVGRNPVASVLYGLRPKRLMLGTMLIAGGMAASAGYLQVTAVYHRLIPNISSNYGYLALLVVMLAGYRAALIAPVALFFACLNAGSIQLPMVLQIDSSLGGVIQGTFVLAALAMQVWRMALPGKRNLDD
jgi:simple sugar transport system permease protein